MNQKPDVTTEASFNGIDQIREIILGDQIVQWDKRFKRLEQSLRNLETKIDTAVKEIRESQKSEANAILKQVNEIKGELNKAFKDLQENKVDKDSIGEVFIQWGQKVKSQ